MPHIGKWQRRFLRLLFATLFALQGWVTFTNMARYSTASDTRQRSNWQTIAMYVSWPIALKMFVATARLWWAILFGVARAFC